MSQLAASSDAGGSVLDENEPVLFGGRVSARWFVECFAALNLIFLGADIYLAHSMNEFSHRSEWVPVIFGLLAGATLVPGLARFEKPLSKQLSILVALGSIAVGVVGTVLHLKSTFFAQQSLKNLVYTAPFAAPMAFIGVGLLLVLNRTERGEPWARWLLFMTSGSFVGLFALALADHAQNGFFYSSEWIGVLAAAFAASFLFVAAVREDVDGSFLGFTAVVMIVQAIVGISGFALHLSANLGEQGTSLWDRFVYGAPAFAPLLYPNMALLGWVGCATLERLRATDDD